MSRYTTKFTNEGKVWRVHEVRQGVKMILAKTRNYSCVSVLKNMHTTNLYVCAWQYVMSTGTSWVLECNRSGSIAILGALCARACMPLDTDYLSFESLQRCPLHFHVMDFWLWLANTVARPLSTLYHSPVCSFALRFLFAALARPYFMLKSSLFSPI